MVKSSETTIWPSCCLCQIHGNKSIWENKMVFSAQAKLFKESAKKSILALFLIGIHSMQG